MKTFIFILILPEELSHPEWEFMIQWNFIESKVITIGVGMCASMAAFLLSSGDERYALPNAEVMIHQPLGGAQGQATDIKNCCRTYIKIKKKKLNRIFSW